MFSRAKMAMLAFLLALVALSACASGSEIPPCTPIEGTDVDPCEPGAGRFSAANSLRAPEAGAPLTINTLVDGEGDGWSAAHLVVRGTYVPNTVRCTTGMGLRPPPFLGWNTVDLDGVSMLSCFADIRANEYIVGSGPSSLTVVVFSIMLPLGPNTPTEYVEKVRREAESALASGGYSGVLEVSPGGIDGREKMMFIGVALNYALEVFQVYEAWDVVRSDGTVMVHHPWRDYWLGEDTANRSKVEWTLTAFDTESTREHNARKQKYGGRTASGAQYPRLIANASNLHQAYVDTSAVNEPVGAPSTELPPACGLAVPDHWLHRELVGDCMVLLGLKDTLRGSATLNWSVDVAMADWDGVRTRDTGRVTDIILVEKSLTGTVPAQLADLTGLRYLWLNRNQLTGTIPPELGSLPSMISLLLNENQLTGPIPTELGNLTTLESLWLHQNQLSGAVPSQLAQLSNLEKLALSANALTGEIPIGLGGLSNLTMLWLDHNQLTGNVPSALGSLSKLRKLTLSNNQLTGAIPTELGDLADTLTELRMSSNQFTGCVPAGLRNVDINDLDQLGLSDCAG